MLTELRIKNFVLIDELSLSFGSGLNVLSGETGAGKSIILGALNLLLGGKASGEMLRDGADQAVIEGLFVVADEPWVPVLLESVGLEPASELWVRRIVTRTGRGRVYLNGGPIVLSVLRTLARGLVDFSSQNEHQVLLDPSSHLTILDAYVGDAALLEGMASASETLKAVKAELTATREHLGRRAEREEFLRFQLGELNRIDPQPREDEILEAERTLLNNAEKLHGQAQRVQECLYGAQGSAIEQLGVALASLREVVAIDPDMADDLASLEGALYAVEDVARSAGSYLGKVQFNPGRLEQINDRLADLSLLKRKYRTDQSGVLARRQKMQIELGGMEGAEERVDGLLREERAAWGAAVDAAQRLSQARSQAARALESTAQEELRSLSMPRARFSIRVAPLSVLKEQDVGLEGLGSRGNDAVEFYFSANEGETPRPLRRVASGGELSRVLLGLKRALAGAGAVGTFVFDEVDAGIGGAVAEVVGRKLWEIAQRRQLLCITHLAQIAAYSQTHFTVWKEVQEGRTCSHVSQLTPDERVEEIARMMGGLQITQRTREHARELIERCQGYRPTSLESQCQS